VAGVVLAAEAAHAQVRAKLTPLIHLLHKLKLQTGSSEQRRLGSRCDSAQSFLHKGFKPHQPLCCDVTALKSVKPLGGGSTRG